jgi:hypothetical protein
LLKLNNTNKHFAWRPLCVSARTSEVNRKIFVGANVFTEVEERNETLYAEYTYFVLQVSILFTSRVLSSMIWCRIVRWKSTDVSEEHVAFIFRVEE